MRELQPLTMSKYTKLIQDCSNRRYFDKDEMRALYKVDSNIWTALRRTNMIAKTGDCDTGISKWIGPHYSESVLRKIMDEYAAINAMKNLKQKRKRFMIKASPQIQFKTQAIIEEAKRIAAERPQPVPVQHDEPFYDNSNSKVMLILAVGAVLGFMIATLIWK